MMMYMIYNTLMTIKPKRRLLLSLMLTNVAGADSVIISAKLARHAPSTLITTVMCTRRVTNYMTTGFQVLDPRMTLNADLVLLLQVCGLLHLQAVSRSRTGPLVSVQSMNAQRLNQISLQADHC